MKKFRIVTGLDLGSAKVAAVTARIFPNGETSIIAHASGVSKGITRGMVTSLNEASRATGACLEKVAEKAHQLGDIYVSSSGETVKGAKSVGMIPLSLRGREVTKHDIAKCAVAAATVRLPFDRELMHKVVHRFSVDDQPWIDNPLGLYASRLSCEVYVVTAAANNIQNINKCVNAAGYDVGKIVFTGVADASCLLDKTDNEARAIIADMGSSLTEICLFDKGKLCDFEVIASGAQDIEGDFRNSPVFLSALGRINSKVEEMKKTGAQVRTICLTGGMAFTDGLVEFAEERLSLPVKMGVAKGLKGDISSAEGLRLTTAIGLIRYAAEEIAKETSARNPSKKLISHFVDLFNEYF